MEFCLKRQYFHQFIVLEGKGILTGPQTACQNQKIVGKTPSAKLAYVVMEKSASLINVFSERNTLLRAPS